MKFHFGHRVGNTAPGTELPITFAPESAPCSSALCLFPSFSNEKGATRFLFLWFSLHQLIKEQSKKRYRLVR